MGDAPNDPITSSHRAFDAVPRTVSNCFAVSRTLQHPAARPRLSIVIPHWPIDSELEKSLGICLASLPTDAEKIIVRNNGTGFARNVNLGIRRASGDFVCVTGNDSRVVRGDVYELCIPDCVASPIVYGKPGVEPGGFHGAFWVAPRNILDAVGLYDEHFEGAFFEDNDYLMRLRQADVRTAQVPSVAVESRRIGLTMSKVPDLAAAWLEANEERFKTKWGFVPPVTDPGLAERASAPVHAPHRRRSRRFRDEIPRHLRADAV